MKFVSFVICLFLSTFFLAAQPKLSINATEIYLGKIMSGETAKSKIVLTNIGKDSLTIYTIQPTCGCTAVKQPKKVLQPKESDTAEIEFHSGGYQGHVTKFVNIITNDPTSPQITVKLIVDVDEIFTPENRTPWFGEITIDDTVHRVLTLTNSSGLPITVKNIITSSPQVKADGKKATVKPNDRYSLDVTVQPKQTGFRNEYVWIETDHPKQQRYEIRISFIGRQKEK